MLFLRRSLMGVLLIALSIGAIGWAGTSVWQAVSAMLNEEPDNRPRREVVLAVNTAEVSAGREVPILRTFGEMRSRRSLVVRSSAAGRLVELSPNFQERMTIMIRFFHRMGIGCTSVPGDRFMIPYQNSRAIFGF